MIVLVYFGAVFAFVTTGGGHRLKIMWIAHIKGGEAEARSVARDFDLTYQDQGVGFFIDHYLMTREDDPDIEADDLTRSLINHEKVKQQLIPDDSKYHIFERSEWDNYDDAQEQTDLNWFLKSVNNTQVVQDCKLGPFGCIVFPSHVLEYLKHVGQKDVKLLGTFTTSPAYEATLDTYKGPTKHLSSSPLQLSAYAFKFSDPDWRKQWHMQDYRTQNYPVMDHNIVPVLNKGITGGSITVGVIGDGVREHPDLSYNFVYSESHDFCYGITGSDPDWKRSTSGYVYDNDGTGSAGVIAMKAGNGICGVGIAPDAKIIGLKIKGCENPKSDMEASALTYNLHDVDIYCNTWTTDDVMGNKLIELSSTVEQALERGTSEGRKNKGSIYVFPSGSNGKNSNCATNGYVNNPYVITVASAASDGERASYSERCTAIFATGYSGDLYKESEEFPTINADGSCMTYDMTKPIGHAVASGIIALVLQYKPSLMYRDMMHLIAMTAEVAPLADNKNSWYRNKKGFWVSNDFGFGLLNAENMINLAQDWQTVPDKNICILNQKLKSPMYFDDTETKTITINASECNGPSNNIVYLEHVELSFTIDYYYRGSIYLSLTSPAGTKSVILERRINDYTKESYKDWNIMTLHNWGEGPKGDWTIDVGACEINGAVNPHGYIYELTLKLHGTEEMPQHYNKARKYSAFRLPNGETNTID